MAEVEKKITYPCSSCGGSLEFKPGSSSLVCPYCGKKNTIEVSSEETLAAVEEQDFLTFLNTQQESAETVDRIVVTCQSCAAEVSLEENQTAGECPFCGTNIVAQTHSVKAIKPGSLLPFKVTKNEAAGHFKTWLKKLWFAPNKLKKYARADGLKGIYLPFWTYDTNTETSYTGQRGVYYYVTESYTTTEDGKTVTKTRQVRKTRWYSASGSVSNSFDDVLVAAAKNLPEKKLKDLEPWDMENLVPFDGKYAAGLQIESYSVDLAEGFDKAKDYMKPTIESSIRHDIGGDEQRISSMSPRYDDITFKHILLPVWLSAYRFKDKVYQFMVNARTGEVQGKRPYSVIKIVLASLFGAALIAGIVFLVLYLQQ